MPRTKILKISTIKDMLLIAYIFYGKINFKNNQINRNKQILLIKEK